MSALVLLERMGDAALVRGDAKASVLAFRRALELARREMLETGDIMLEGAIVSFSRKLGEALERSGDVAGADGVLREAVDLAGPHSVERARMLLALGRVAARRDRRRDALRLLGQALEIATSQREREVEARIHAATARVRREDGDAETAASGLAKAVQIEEELKLDPARRARTALEHAEVLLDLGELDPATERLELVARLAEQAGSPALSAAAMGLLGMVDHHRGSRMEAGVRYREAAGKAAQAGDADAYTRWKAAADSLAVL
jgi:serine/threonine-protein kinase